ncbi:Processing alpha glucosidase I [Clavispora lusitaniae]|nr:Processing alpha glucosidase I [Clavispora lusitaniae]
MRPFLLWLSLFLSALGQQFFDLDEPVPFDQLSPDAQYHSLAQDSLLWGPYRSGNYLGIRPRIPHSLMSGLLWFPAESSNAFSSGKHFYEQSHNVGKANWVQFDPRLGGRQIISDNDCHLGITIDFVKSDNGRNWGVKVHAKPHKGHESVKTSFVWYSGLEGESDSEEAHGFLKLDTAMDSTGYDGEVTLAGLSKDFGLFTLSVNDAKTGAKNKHPRVKKLFLPALDPRRTHHTSLRVPDDNVWRAGDIFFTLLQESIQTIDESGIHSKRRPVGPCRTGKLRRKLSHWCRRFYALMFV